MVFRRDHSLENGQEALSSAGAFLLFKTSSPFVMKTSRFYAALGAPAAFKSGLFMEESLEIKILSPRRSAPFLRPGGGFPFEKVLFAGNPLQPEGLQQGCGQREERLRF
jgi:hypothetical protein